ncbi:MAG: energy transducer TonB [Candidatus Marinimicrobia bacterium]|nr:energy transducer TonB [Candidatus Neomarinimicrobiota bacterium]
MKVDLGGDFRDIDDMKWIDPITASIDLSLKMDGSSSYSDNDKTMVRVFTAIVDAAYPITKNLNLSVGAFYSLWENVLTVPTFKYTDVTWRPQKNELSLGGVNISLTFTGQLALSPPSPPPEPSPPPGYQRTPQPIGGYAAIIKNLVYPESAREAGIEGRVVIKAFVDATGTVTETVVQQGIRNSGLDEAAIEAITQTSWEPAIKEGKPVGVWISIPVDFGLR